jgi:hypothetical protein
MSTHGPIEPGLHRTMNDLGRLIGGAFKVQGDYGFVLLGFGFNTQKGRMNYISNARREDIIVALKELLARFEGFDVETPETKQ